MTIPAEDYLRIKASDFECDCCEETFPPKDRRYVITPRPSCPDELVAVMWTCPACAPSMDAMTAAECETYRKEHGHLWLSI
jgi:hypothetical protein